MDITWALNIYPGYKGDTDLGAKVLGILAGEGFRPVGNMGERTVIVQDAGYVMWALCDNGGEVNVERINSGELPVSVQFLHSVPLRRAAGPWTLASRLAHALRGEAIDYAADWDEGAEGVALPLAA